MKELQRSFMDRDELMKVRGFLDQKNHLAEMAKGFQITRPWEGLFPGTAALEAARTALVSPGRRIEELSKSISGFKRTFRLPESGETTDLFKQAMSTDDAMRSVIYRVGFQSGIHADFARLNTPWIDAANPLKSVVAFANLETLSSISVRGAFGDVEANAFVRQALGDWRDKMTFSITMDHVARTALYAEQGVDPELTDFPEDSFTEIVDVMGLAFNEDYAGIAGAVVFDEDGLRRNHDAYDRVVRFEIVLRAFLTAAMKKQFGPNWWKQRVPGNILELWRERLLIFDQLPRSDQPGKLLNFKQLVSDGRTIQYSDLPERLWATTGIKIKNLKPYAAFGKLRNMIQHFAPPQGVDLSQQTLEFIYAVVDPFINECWDLYAVDHVEDNDLDEHFIPGLVRREIKFLVPPGADLEKYVEWPKNEAYTRTMKKRMAQAKAMPPA